MTDTRITKTPVLTPDDIATITRAAQLAGLIGPDASLSRQDLREFGILLYQVRARSEARLLAQAMLEMSKFRWRNPTSNDSD